MLVFVLVNKKKKVKKTLNMEDGSSQDISIELPPKAIGYDILVDKEDSHIFVC